MTSTQTGGASRREFLQTAAAAVATQAVLSSGVHAAGNDEIRVGLIGCGGRGTGAADNVLHAAKNVKIVALADAFKDRAEGCRNRLLDLAKNEDVKDRGNSVDIPAERVYVGLDAYKQLLASSVNYVILATPPGFRPIHLQAAVAAGKNIFTEKPVGVDGPGIRAVLGAYEDAKQKRLGIAAGTQRRHQLGYLETMKQIHDGAIGDVVAGRCYWNQGLLWKRDRQANWTDLEWQMRDWYNFTWLCGDHIVEQHVHNLDVMNWALQAHPVRCAGMGFCTRLMSAPEQGSTPPRPDPNWGHIFDFFAIDYEYPKEAHVLSMCRQISNCWSSVSEALQGSKGICHPNAYTVNSKRTLSREQDRQATDPYVQEHTDLIASIRAGKPINELKQVAESTLTAIMGRMSAYTGQMISWEQALASEETLMPKELTWDMKLPLPSVALPGKTKLG
jgi:predicted dehydrogenase